MYVWRGSQSKRKEILKEIIKLPNNNKQKFLKTKI